jgi:tetratricopeptide (TPR) repeat protein
MTKMGRNDRCHCGSGKKYKKCCLAADEARAQELANAALVEHERDGQGGDRHDDRLCAECGHEMDELEEMSNEALDLIEAGEFEEAEQLCRELAVRFPDCIDGTERLGQLFEAKGEDKAAARQYRLAAAMTETVATQTVDAGGRAWYLKQAERLDPRVAK